MCLFLEDAQAAIPFGRVSELIRTHLSAQSWRRVLLIPPDITRSHSGAGPITDLYYRELTARGCSVSVLPALGTHSPMTREERRRMYGAAIPDEAYLTHDCRSGIREVGVVPAQTMAELSNGLFTDSVSVSINAALLDPSYDAILSIGQVIPHEIAGMANYTKNLVVGCGGGEMIQVSHFLGVFYGLERLLGVDHNPVRDLFDYVQTHLLDRLPLTFVQTVMCQQGGEDVYRGVYIGRDRTPYEKAVTLSQRVNFTVLDKPAEKCVVWMDPLSYRSTWVANKAIYRTQLAVAPGGDIVVIAPGVHAFGENPTADAIIRRYGYKDRETVLRLCETEPLLRENLSMAGHLIHGVPGSGIRVTYCTDGLTREEVLGGGFNGYMSVREALARYPCGGWETGWRTLPDGEEIYFVKNAALGMWRAQNQKEES